MVLGGVVALEGDATVARRFFPLAGVPGSVVVRLGSGLCAWQSVAGRSGRPDVAGPR